MNNKKEAIEFLKSWCDKFFVLGSITDNHWIFKSNMTTEQIVEYLERAKSYVLKNNLFGEYYPACDKCEGTGINKERNNDAV